MRPIRIIVKIYSRGRYAKVGRILLHAPAFKFLRSFNCRSFRSTVFPLFSAAKSFLSSSVDDFRGLPLTFCSSEEAESQEDFDPVQESAMATTDFTALFPLPHTMSF